jgi:hypothetical protein
MLKKYCIFTLSVLLHFVNFGIIEASDVSSAGEAKQSEVATSYEDQSHYIAPDEFETQNLKLEAISSAKQDIDCYLAIYKDCGYDHYKSSWFSGCPISSPYPDNRNTPEGVRYIQENLCNPDPIFESQHARIQAKAEEEFRKQEQEGIYTLPNSFPNYVICDKETGEMVGKFISCHRVQKGRIEKGIYILSKYRREGYASEVLRGFITHVINPALGKSFIVSSEIHPEFKGMYAKIAPWYNYPSLKANASAGCVTRWDSYYKAPITFYPAGDEKHLDLSDDGLRSFLSVIKEFYGVSETNLVKTLPLDFPRGVEDLCCWAKICLTEFKKELVLGDLDTLCSIRDESTASFAQEALDILDDVSSGTEEEEVPEETLIAGSRRPRD